MSGGSSGSDEQIQSENELIVYGYGIGSTVDLEVTTGDLRICADDLRALATRLRAAVQDVRVASYVVAATAHLTFTGPAAREEVQRLAADGELRAGELDDLAGRLDATADRYEDAEARNEATIWHVERPWWASFHPALWFGLVLDMAMLDAAMHGQRWPTRHGAGLLVNELTWTVMRSGGSILGAARALADLANELIDKNGMRVEQVQPLGAPGPGEEHGAIGDLQGVVDAIDGLYPENGTVPPGTVRIDRITTAEGETSWLVLIPGTQGELVSDHAFDWASNPGGMIGDATPTIASVVLAMRMAGIKPGQPVAVAGHSQGGLAAVTVANMMEEEGLDVAGVLSLGAPIGLLDTPPGTEVMSVEHTEDPTPGLDNAAPPVGENVTVVERPLNLSSDPDINEISSPSGSHDTPTYADTARLIDASDDPAVLDWLATVGGILDEDATATTSYYQGTRVP